MKMDPSEIIKAAPEIAKGVTEVSAALSLTPIIKAFLGDAADEIGKRLGDRVRLYRFGRSLDMLKKAERMAKDAGFTPKAVPIKLLFPLLEGASFEENEDLHTMWAALLSNAGLPSSKVRPVFISTLKQMAADEAYLRAISNHTDNYAEPLDRSKAQTKQALDRLIFAGNNILFTRLQEDFAVNTNPKCRRTILHMCAGSSGWCIDSF